jgi:hypothetical protein
MGDHMKKPILLMIVLLLAFPKAASAQQPRSRDLFLHYERGNPTAGQPGAKLMVELNRAGETRMVSPETKFQSGDRIRFHLSLNFDGYLAVLNSGTSGKLNCLYPYSGAPNPVHASSELMVPGHEAWFVFDQTPGTEEVTFLLSKKPIEELQELPGAAGDSGMQTTTNAGTEKQPLEKLHARASQASRDLQLQIADDASYGTASEGDFSGLVKFTVFLKHVR